MHTKINEHHHWLFLPSFLHICWSFQHHLNIPSYSRHVKLFHPRISKNPKNVRFDLKLSINSNNIKSPKTRQVYIWPWEVKFIVAILSKIVGQKEYLHIQVLIKIWKYKKNLIEPKFQWQSIHTMDPRIHFLMKTNT